MEALPHGIGVQNRYALFYDEGLDPLEILKQTEEQKTKKKTDKTQKVKTAKTTPSAPLKKTLETLPSKVVKTPDQDNSLKPRGKPALQSKISNQNDTRENDKNTRNRDDQFFSGEARESSEFRRGRGGFRGRGGPSRGRGFYPNTDNRNRRVFDRKSGSDKTGVRPTEKREGAGSNNWGDIRSDINQRRDETSWDEEFDGEASVRPVFGSSGEEQGNEFGKADDAAKIESLENTESKENDQITEEQIQDAMKEMTLDEYKKEQEAKRVVPKFNLRKPGEGEDEKQWKKGYVLKKKPKEDDDEQDEEDDMEDEEYGRKNQQKVLLDIQFNYADSRRGNRGRGRGGRGGPRSGPRDAANRDAPREDRPREIRGGRIGGPPKSKGGQQAAPRVDDFNDFPSLVNA